MKRRETWHVSSANSDSPEYVLFSGSHSTAVAFYKRERRKHWCGDVHLWRFCDEADNARLIALKKAE